LAAKKDSLLGENVGGNSSTKSLKNETHNSEREKTKPKNSQKNMDCKSGRKTPFSQKEA